MQILPFVYAFCDTDYWENYGKALEASLKAAGHEHWVECSGVKVTDWPSKHYHSQYRYKRLPELLQKHSRVMLLDADSIVRFPAEVPENYDIGIVYDKNSGDWMRCVNGGCFYITGKMLPLAEKLAKRIDYSHWFSDQASLFRLCVKHGDAYKKWIIDGEFFSWRENPKAPIWTGKGKAKSQKGFLAEVLKWNIISSTS